MYKHTQTAFGSFSRHTIYSDRSRQSFSFVPERGACLLELQFGDHNILDGYTSPEEVDFNRWAKSGLLFPFPNRLRDGQYEWRGQTYQFPLNDDQRNNALHGFGMDKPFRVDGIQLDQGEAAVHLAYSYEGDNASYPFPFTFGCSFGIKDGGEWWAELSLLNTGDVPIPAGLGYHPYFRLADRVDDLRLQLPPVEMIGVDQRMIPTGKRYDYVEYQSLSPIGVDVLDNCFVLKQRSGTAEVIVRGPLGEMRYWQESGQGRFPFVQIFTHPDRNSLAIEPMTCNIDAFHNGEGLAVLGPREEIRARFGITYTPH